MGRKKSSKTKKRKKKNNGVYRRQSTWRLLELALPEALDRAGLMHIVVVLRLEDEWMLASDPIIDPAPPEEIVGALMRPLLAAPSAERPARVVYSDPRLRETLDQHLRACEKIEWIRARGRTC